MRTSFWKTRQSLHRQPPKAALRVGAGVLSVVVVLGALWLWRGAIGAGASALFYPAFKARVWFAESGSAVPAFFRTRSSLSREIAALQEELRDGAGDRARIAYLEGEARARGTKQFSAESHIPAAVLAGPSMLPYDTLLVDKGIRDGVQEGAVVYVGTNIALGAVLRVYEKSALVLLASAPGVHTTVYIFGPDIFAEAEGQGGGVLRVRVPAGVPVAEGDLVVLPGADAGFFGEVVGIEFEPEEPNQYAFVTPPVPLRGLRLLHIATAPPPALSYEEAREALAAFVRRSAGEGGAQEQLFPVEIPVSAFGPATSTATSTGTPVLE